MTNWTLTAQLHSGGTLTVGTNEHLWWNGSSFGDNITVGSYQDSTHVADSSDIQLDTVSPVHNTKFIDSTHVSIDGAGSSSFPIATDSCALLFTFSDASSVTTSNAKLYAYDGVEDINPISNIHFQAAEGAHSTSWTDANGFDNALALADQSANTTHPFYIAASISPLTAGLKAGKIKIVINYI